MLSAALDLNRTNSVFNKPPSPRASTRRNVVHSSVLKPFVFSQLLDVEVHLSDQEGRGLSEEGGPCWTRSSLEVVILLVGCFFVSLRVWFPAECVRLFAWYRPVKDNGALLVCFSTHLLHSSSGRRAGGHSLHAILCFSVQKLYCIFHPDGFQLGRCKVDKRVISTL